MNQCAKVENHVAILPAYHITNAHPLIKEINDANAIVEKAADLYSRYRKNVQYNLDATGTAPEAK